MTVPRGAKLTGDSARWGGDGGAKLTGDSAQGRGALPDGHERWAVGGVWYGAGSSHLTSSHPTALELKRSVVEAMVLQSLLLKASLVS